MRGIPKHSQSRSESLVRMESIVKAFSGVRVLHGVDFEVQRGEIMALMGENGAGKSTLMKILVGVYDDWEGRISIDETERRFTDTREAEKAGIAIMYQEINMVPELTVAENIFLGREPCTWGGCVDYIQMNRMAESILADLHFTVPVTTPVSQLRVGLQQLVEIGKALSLNARVVIMDEPTSALSKREIETLFSVIEKLKSRNVSVIYISHRIGEVFRVADRVTVLRDGRTVDIKHVEDLNRQDLIGMMVGRRFDQFFVKEGHPEDDVVMRVEHLTRIQPNRQGKPLIEDVSFELKRGEQLGIAGLLGSGRTELLEALFGVDSENTTGTVEIEGKAVHFSHPHHAMDAGMGLITEDRKGSGLVLGMSVEHNMTLAALKAILTFIFISRKKERNLSKAYMNRLSINVPDLDNPIDTLSGGNQQKVLLAKWLAIHPKILLLDEPTRGIDVGAKHEIYLLLSKLVKQGISIVIASSELTELLSLCDRIMVLREGKLSAIFSRDEATQEKIMEAAAPVG